MILAECRDEVLPVCLRRALFGLLADEGRIVTDVVIAGKIAAVDGQRVVQSFCEIEIVRMIRTVERNVAAVDDEVGPVVVDMLAHAVKVLDELGKPGAEMCVGDLGQAEAGRQAGHGEAPLRSILHTAHVSEMA